MPPMTNSGVLFFRVADWRTLQKPMAAMASRWSRPSIGCNRPLVKPVPASWPAWAEAAVAVTIRPVAISSRVSFVMVVLLCLRFASSDFGDFVRASFGQHAPVENKADNRLQPYPVVKVGKHKW